MTNDVSDPAPGAPDPAAAAAPLGIILSGIFVAVAAWAGYALATHPGFQPVTTLRTVTPVLALVLGAAFTHLVARLRRRVDIEGEFNPSGRALFLGFVMLVATLLAWLIVTQALPASLNGSLGAHRAETGEVVRKLLAESDPDCRYRIEVTSASVTRPMDECVDLSLWNQAAPGGAVTVDVVGSPLGAEVLGLRR